MPQSQRKCAMKVDVNAGLGFSWACSLHGAILSTADTPKLRDSVISIIDFLPDGAKELLQHHGRFTRSTLESCVEFSESIPLQFFVDILEHVKIVAAIDQTSEYFMPCALPYATEMPHSSHPWVIRLRVSRGVDERVCSYPSGLSTCHSSLPSYNVLWSLFVNSTPVDNIEMWSSCITSLEEWSVWWSATFNWRYTILALTNFARVQIIRNHVLESIRLTEEKLHIREGAITKVDSFLCSCGKGRAHHICAYNPETHIVECEVTREVSVLERQHQLWLGVWYNQNCSLCWYMWYCIDV